MFCGIVMIENYRSNLLKLKLNGLYNYTKTTHTMNIHEYTYNTPLTERQTKRHNKFKGAHGNLTKKRCKYMKRLVKTILKGHEVCGCPEEVSIALVKKYVDARMDNRDKVRETWQEIVSLARNIHPDRIILPSILDEGGPEVYHHNFMWVYEKTDIVSHR